MSAIDKVNDPLGPRQASGVNKPGNAAKQSQRSPLIAKDVLELSSHRLEEAERQVEAEFAARKARVIAQEKADQYDPDKAMDQIAKLLANIDMRFAEALKQEDQHMILTAAAQGVGFTKLNQVVGEWLRSWLAVAAPSAGVVGVVSASSRSVKSWGMRLRR